MEIKKIMILLCAIFVLAQISFAAEIKDNAHVLSDITINRTNVVLKNIETKAKTDVNIIIENTTNEKNVNDYLTSKNKEIYVLILVNKKTYSIAKDNDVNLTQQQLEILKSRIEVPLKVGNYNAVVSNIASGLNNAIAQNQRLVPAPITTHTSLANQPTNTKSNNGIWFVIGFGVVLLIGVIIYFYEKHEKNNGVKNDGQEKSE